MEEATELGEGRLLGQAPAGGFIDLSGVSQTPLSKAISG
jgi:hypothetical protein